MWLDGTGSNSLRCVMLRHCDPPGSDHEACEPCQARPEQASGAVPGVPEGTGCPSGLTATVYLRA